MLQTLLLLVLQLAAIVVDAQNATKSTSQKCRCFPGDSCWPSSQEWDAFNQTLNGKLIATVPLSSVCHNDNFTAYNEGECSFLQSLYYFPEIHVLSPSSIMAELFTNNSCNPFAPRNASCTIGNFVEYSVNATGPEDYKTVIDFVTEHDIRLVIKNTGHDYNGKSTGAGAVGIWTHNMNSLELIENYISPNYTGPAIKMGAGVQVYDLYVFADKHQLVAVGGAAPTLGVAGGYTQGGGHGPLASKFGLAADNVLEWEVVTGTGELLNATVSNNSDLYWALSGGGGGTYGIVSSLTVKAHPAFNMSAANLTFSQDTDIDAFWDVVETFQASLPDLVDTGAMAIFSIADGNFSLEPASGPGIPKNELQTLLNPTLAKLNASGIPYTFDIDEYPDFLSAYKAYWPPWNASQSLLGGRLIPRTLVESNATSGLDGLTALTAAMRNITDTGAVVSGICINVSHSVQDYDSNAVNPAWRTAIWDATIGTGYSYSNFSLDYTSQDVITYDLLPQLEELSPGGGAYLNEADFQQPNWQGVLYGEHYGTLLKIKQKYDPNGIFYAITAVGSEGWYEDKSQGGRLCHA